MLAYVTEISRTGCWVAQKINHLSFFSASICRVELDLSNEMSLGFSAHVSSYHKVPIFSSLQMSVRLISELT